jgi:hypothetical protein
VQVAAKKSALPSLLSFLTKSTKCSETQRKFHHRIGCWLDPDCIKSSETLSSQSIKKTENSSLTVVAPSSTEGFSTHKQGEESNENNETINVISDEKEKIVNKYLEVSNGELNKRIKEESGEQFNPIFNENSITNQKLIKQTCEPILDGTNKVFGK